MKIFREMMERQKSGDMSKFLIVDLNNLLYKAIHIHQNLYSEEIFTGGLYGVLSQIKTAIEKYEISQVVICVDSPPYLRKSLFEGLKSDRKKDSFFETKICVSRQMCEYVLGRFFTIWKVKGLESDDLIANAARCLQNVSEIYIQSEDSDLFQCLRNNVSMIFKGKNFTKKDFEEKYKLSVCRWAWVSALTGGHNNLPGFPGIGEKTALRIVRDKLSLLAFVQKNSISLKFYHLSKLPIFKLNLPYLKMLTDNAIYNAEEWIKTMGFKVSK